jgi:lipid II:glycine glycyltransferase (peptidoglycan interpeptide bridge formation enzyme)
VFETFGKSRVRQVVTKAQQRGDVEIRSATSEADIADVFYGLHLDTRRRLGVPVQPRRFFRMLWQRMLEPGFGNALLAYHEGIPIAGAVFLAWKKTVIYKFGASLQHFQPLRPNHLLLWSAIRDACTRGFTTFDFGRTDLDGNGLREFKLGWGTDEELLTFSTFGGRNKARRGSGGAGNALASVLRRSPPWLCRATGELFYKYTA